MTWSPRVYPKHCRRPPTTNHPPLAIILCSVHIRWLKIGVTAAMLGSLYYRLTFSPRKSPTLGPAAACRIVKSPSTVASLLICLVPAACAYSCTPLSRWLPSTKHPPPNLLLPREALSDALSVPSCILCIPEALLRCPVKPQPRFREPELNSPSVVIISSRFRRTIPTTLRHLIRTA